jgi:hypothetical protein
MSATATRGGPADPLAGVAQALSGFRARIAETGDGLRKATGGVTGAADAMDRIRSGAGQGGTALREVKASAEAAARSVAKSGQSAATASSGVAAAGGKVRGAKGTLGILVAGIGGAAAILGGLITVSGALGDLLDKFGTAMAIGSAVMTVINLITKASPIGFVTGLLLPVAGYLIDLAVNSETGQRIMQQVFDLAEKYVVGYLQVIGPVLKVIGAAVATYFTAYVTVITTAIAAVGTAIGTAFALVRSVVSGDTRSLRGAVSSVWNGFRSALKPAITWITQDIPKMFQRVKDAMSSTLGGIGGFVTTGAQTVAGVVKGSLNGLIAFANWVIDGLNSLSFSFLGKKFGVHLGKIPMLAEGGIAVPGTARRAGRVLPLTELDRRKLRTAQAARAGSQVRLGEFRESAAAGARNTAEDLLFLASAHA